MTTGRINQVATSRPAPQPLQKETKKRAARVSPPTPRCRPHRARRASGVCPSERTDDCDQCRSKALRQHTRQPRGSVCRRAVERFVLPSCIYPRPSYRGVAPSRRLLRAETTSRGPPGRCAIVEPSLRGARGFTHTLLSQNERERAVAAAVSRHRFGANAGHCLRTRCFLRRPALHSGARGRGLMAGCRPRRPQTTAAWRARDRGSSGRGARRARDTDT